MIASHTHADIALLWGRKQPFSVRTEELTELFWLSELDFHSIMIEYPDMVIIMKTIARQRLNHFRIPEMCVQKPATVRRSPPCA